MATACLEARMLSKGSALRCGTVWALRALRRDFPINVIVLVHDLVDWNQRDSARLTRCLKAQRLISDSSNPTAYVLDFPGRDRKRRLLGPAWMLERAHLSVPAIARRLFTTRRQ